jgi:leucyl/phenylalanyl-tRNA--protein transferase
MSVFILNKSLQMPSPELADPDGLLAIGGDLSAERLIRAYKMGIFPWFNEDEQIMWWSPDPRFVLFPDDLIVSTSMRKLIRKNAFNVTFNKDFAAVINACKTIKRKGENGTWITDQMEDAYNDLHKLGIAHSVEVWEGENLVGGLYGIRFGKVYFGESMFSRKNNASKFGFITWVEKLKCEGVVLIDCQIANDHVSSLGANEIPREDFLKIIRENID